MESGGNLAFLFYIYLTTMLFIIDFEWIFKYLLIGLGSFTLIISGYFIAKGIVEKKFREYGEKIHRNKISFAKANFNITVAVLPICLACSGFLSLLAPPFFLNISILGFIMMFPSMLFGVSSTLRELKKEAETDD